MPRKALKKARIRVDYNNMMSDNVGGEGVARADINKIMPLLKRAARSVKQKRDDALLGFMLLPYDSKTREEVKKSAERIKRDFENFVVIGAGGTALGSAAMHSAVKHPYFNMLPHDKRKAPRFFMLDGNDPETLEGLFDVLDLKRTCVNIISKSGATAATAALAKIVLKKMAAVLGQKALPENVIITTSRQSGALRILAAKYALPVFTVPDNVSSRFSVLSPAGLLPAYACGVNTDEVLRGAAYMDSVISGDNVLKNPAYIMAALRYISDKKFGRKVSVTMPYSDSLRVLFEWHSGLIAGVTGSKYALDGRMINSGLTPVSVIGPAGHHSVLQLLIEGPYDKIITFIKNEKPRYDQQIPSDFSETAELAALGGRKNNRLMDIQFESCRDELTSAQKQNMTIFLPELNEFVVGQLIYMLETEAVFLAELYNIGAFSQPGSDKVEKKIYAKLGVKEASARKSQSGAGKISAKYII